MVLERRRFLLYAHAELEDGGWSKNVLCCSTKSTDAGMKMTARKSCVKNQIVFWVTVVKSKQHSSTENQ
ncbi:unnamed protein product [Amoebophrya sp. A120]|nr:unnamed protein product [Amoebophrya sp. A120]|eukprot:GSA120T00006124001.1